MPGKMSQGSIALDILNGAQGGDLQNIEARVQTAVDAMDMSLFNKVIGDYADSPDNNQSGSVIPDNLSGSYELVDFDFTYNNVHVEPEDINNDFDGNLTIQPNGSTFIYLDMAGYQESANGSLSRVDNDTLIDNAGDTVDFAINDDIMTWSLEGGAFGLIGLDADLDWQYLV